MTRDLNSVWNEINDVIDRRVAEITWPSGSHRAYIRNRTVYYLFRTFVHPHDFHLGDKPLPEKAAVTSILEAIRTEPVAAILRGTGRSLHAGSRPHAYYLEVLRANAQGDLPNTLPPGTNTPTWFDPPAWYTAPNVQWQPQPTTLTYYVPPHLFIEQHIRLEIAKALIAAGKASDATLLEAIATAVIGPPPIPAGNCVPHAEG